MNNSCKAVLAAWALAIVVFYFVVAEGNIRHSYYHLPTTTIGTLLATLAVSRLHERLVSFRRWLALPAAALVLIGLGAVAKVGIERASLIQPMQPQLYQVLTMCRDLALMSDPKDLVVTSCAHGQPEILYYANRKGWLARFFNHPVWPF